MPLLAAWIGNLISGVLAWLLARIGAKVASSVAIYAALAVAIGVCWVAISAIISGLIPAMPSIVTVSASWIVPSQFNTCLGAVIGTEISLGAYRKAKNVALSQAAT